MDQVNAVEVFGFRVFDPRAHELRVSKYKASRHVIVTLFGGEVLEGTAEHVSSKDLDEHGRYRRIATGWGELP
ncbi:MAG: hypothetical protein QFE16_07785 [Pseudomonadota bacterium]|nr:hypothetical protein [Pseudomonadota bacterium]